MSFVGPVVYRHFNKEGKLLYVGSSVSVLTRQAAHRNVSPWFADVATITVEHFPDRASMLRAERSAIVNEKPAHNIAEAVDENGAPRRKKPVLTEFKSSPEAISRAAYLAGRLEVLSREDTKILMEKTGMVLVTVRKIVGGYVPSLRTLDKLTAYFKKLDRKTKP